VVGIMTTVGWGATLWCQPPSKVRMCPVMPHHNPIGLPPPPPHGAIHGATAPTANITLQSSSAEKTSAPCHDLFDARVGRTPELKST